MIQLKTFENFDINLKLCDKSKESYDFISKYLDVMDFESYISNENLYQICAYDGNTLIGISIFKMKDSKIHLNYSAVDDGWRRQGINTKMKNKIIEIAKEEGCNIITVNVRESNKPSLNSLLNLGFKINDRVSLNYPDGEKKIPLYYNIQLLENIDNFKSFFKKYKKSGYISVADKKRLSKGSVTGDDFTEIQERIQLSIDMLKLIDVQDIKDFMINADLDAPALVDSLRVWFSLNIDPGKESTSRDAGKSNIFGKIDPFNMVISKDERGLPSKEGLNIDDSIDDLVENLIHLVDYKKKLELDKNKTKITKDSKNRGDFSEITYRRLLQTNHFKNIKINPVISLEIFYQFPKKQKDGDSYSDPNYHEKDKIHKYFQAWIENDVIGRLFKFLGIQNPFKVTPYYQYGYSEDLVKYEVEIII